MPKYSRRFYKASQEGAIRSAQEIVPLILDLIHPKSVVDVGCGTGEWLSVFREYGIEDILGVDGVYVDRMMLRIPDEKFIPADLKKTLPINRRFDLVMSLEVAEHLPIECAEDFIKSLVRLGPVVLFSASIPFQGGGRHHVNEQWPDYWNRLFQRQGYMVVDALRRKIWHNTKIEVWYRQNILLFVKEEYLTDHATLKKEHEKTNAELLSIVHPELFCYNRLPEIMIRIKNTRKRILKKIFHRDGIN